MTRIIRVSGSRTPTIVSPHDIFFSVTVEMLAINLQLTVPIAHNMERWLCWGYSLTTATVPQFLSKNSFHWFIKSFDQL